MKNSVRISLIFLSMVALSGCASVSLLHSAKDPAVPVKQYKKLLVVGIAERPQMRQVFEEVFAGEVRKGGADAIASYSITGVNDKLSRAAVVEAVKKSGADGVITTRLVGSSKKSAVRTGFVMVDRGVNAFYGASVSYAEFVHQPVEVVTSTQVSIETNLFDAGTGMMVWSGTSSAVNPEGIINVSTQVADIAIKAMKKDGLQ
ncbi:MAG: hypothetical protein ACOYL3_12625 [Desulfuromonadaceae bacterium]